MSLLEHGLYGFANGIGKTSGAIVILGLTYVIYSFYSSDPVSISSRTKQDKASITENLTKEEADSYKRLFNKL